MKSVWLIVIVTDNRIEKGVIFMTRHEENIFLKEHMNDNNFQELLRSHPYASVSDLIYLYQHSKDVDSKVLKVATRETYEEMIVKQQEKLDECGDDINKAEYYRGVIQGLRMGLMIYLKDQNAKAEFLLKKTL